MILNELLKLKDEGVYKRLIKQPKSFEYIGIKMGDLRRFSTQLSKDNALAQTLFDLNYYETKLLATMLVEPSSLSKSTVLAWIKAAQQSAIIDQGIANFFLELSHPTELLMSLSNTIDDDLEYGFWALLSTFFRQADLAIIESCPCKDWLNTIATTINRKPLSIQNAMNNAVVMAGLHVPNLVELAQNVADQIGYILPMKAKNSCNIQSASDYLVRYRHNPKYSRVAKMAQKQLND